MEGFWETVLLIHIFYLQVPGNLKEWCAVTKFLLCELFELNVVFYC